jgi:hypothetical protein
MENMRLRSFARPAIGRSVHIRGVADGLDITSTGEITDVGISESRDG